MRIWLGFQSWGGFEDCGLESFGCETGQACTPWAGPCIYSTCTKVKARPAPQRHATASRTPDLVLAFANDPTSLPYEPVNIAVNTYMDVSNVVRSWHFESVVLSVACFAGTPSRYMYNRQLERLDTYFRKLCKSIVGQLPGKKMYTRMARVNIFIDRNNNMNK